MPVHPKTSRIVIWTATLIGLMSLGFFAYERLAFTQPVEPIICEPIPSNVVKLGPAIAVDNPNALPDMSEMGWPELRTKLRKGDALREFETQTTGGHLAMRGGCYLGQAIAWMR